MSAMDSSFPSSSRPNAKLAPVRSTRQLLCIVALLSLAATMLLQIWRPFFYLTDDNLSGYLPAVVEISRKLWAGQWPFINDHVYGGNYNLLSDPSCFGLLSPWLLLFSWVALTPYYYALAEIISLCNSIAIACSFGWAALWFRREFKLPAPDWLIVTLSLSYAFTPYNMIVGSSWIGFLNGQASFPLILVGFYHRSHIRGILLQTVALLYGLWGGHAHTFLVLCVFSGLVAVVVSILRRDAKPAGRLMVAAVLFTLISLPLLIPNLGGFQASPRAAGVSIADASKSRIPALPLAISYVLGPGAAAFDLRGLPTHGADPGFNLSLAYALANIGILASLFSWRKLSALSMALAVCFAAGAVMVIRPPWLAEAISHIPLLRSLQWPFRELWLLHFAGHMLLVLNYRAPSRVVLASVSSAALLIFSGLFFNRPPTFYLFDLDRRLVISGEAERYWTQLLRDHNSPPHVIVGMDPRFLVYFRNDVPFTLLGSYNFGPLFGFIHDSGYTFTVSPQAQRHADGPRPYAFPGAYTPDDAMKIWKQDPSVWRIDLTRVRPAEWSISYGTKQRRFRLLPETGEVVELPVPTTPGSPVEPTAPSPPNSQ